MIDKHTTAFWLESAGHYPGRFSLEKIFIFLMVVGFAVAAYGLYQCNEINNRAMSMGQLMPKDNLQSELCIKAGCFYVSVEDKINHEANTLISAIGVFIGVFSLFLRRIYNNKFK